LVLATIILLFSFALCLFYLQAACQSILRREVDLIRLTSMVSATDLEFLYVRQGIEESGRGLDYAWVRAALQGDYQALTFLLKHALSGNGTHSREERLLMVYCRAMFVILSISHLLKLNEKRAIRKLTAILEHFAAGLGEAVGEIQFVSLTAHE